MDRTALDVSNFGFAAFIRNADGRLLLALFGQHLYSFIVAMEVEGIIGCFFTIEVNGVGPGSLGVLRHLEFFFCGLLELRV